MAEFIIGTVSQRHHQIGETISAYRYNTMFFTGVCEGPNYLDFGQSLGEIRAKLRRIGSMAFELGKIHDLGDGASFAEVSPREDAEEKWQKILRYLIPGDLDGYSVQSPLITTLSPSTALKAGDHLSVGYLTVLEPLGEGEYKIHHDYPICFSGPRYEMFDDDPDQYIRSHAEQLAGIR